MVVFNTSFCNSVIYLDILYLDVLYLDVLGKICLLNRFYAVEKKLCSTTTLNQSKRTSLS